MSHRIGSTIITLSGAGAKYALSFVLRTGMRARNNVLRVPVMVSKCSCMAYSRDTSPFVTWPNPLQLSMFTLTSTRTKRWVKMILSWPLEVNSSTWLQALTQLSSTKQLCSSVIEDGVLRPPKRALTQRSQGKHVSSVENLSSLESGVDAKARSCLVTFGLNFGPRQTSLVAASLGTLRRVTVLRSTLSLARVLLFLMEFVPISAKK
mmetsp:Transcript_7154/g.21297  ORF Transcript_7154/g.21297 Transcript_7154/m.21297 type:complete len:207 (+) Transcript_7154:1165-1785(+)